MSHAKCPAGLEGRVWATGCLAAVQTINHWRWQVDYDPLSVFMCFWDWEETHSPDIVKWTKWCKRRKGTAVSQEGLNQNMGKVLLPYCTIVLRESMFYCYWHQTPDSHLEQISLRSPPWPKPNLWCCIIKCAVWNWKVSDTDTTWLIIKSWSNTLQCFLFFLM